MKIVIAALMLFSVFAHADVVIAPDGIQIGPSTVLPVREFDEYPFALTIGEMAGGEVKILDFGSDVTFHPGARCTAELYTPDAEGIKRLTLNGDKLLILHAWFDYYNAKVMIKNLDNSTVDFGYQEIIFTCWNTSNYKQTIKGINSHKSIAGHK